MGLKMLGHSKIVFPWLISQMVYLPLSKFSNRMIKFELNNERSKAGVVYMTPLGNTSTIINNDKKNVI